MIKSLVATIVVFIHKHNKHQLVFEQTINDLKFIVVILLLGILFFVGYVIL